mgnify:CR=1 FL=1|jgi:hypothetical protein|tara:strand:- start:2125 stop:2349 length:225 start_codon:yes stop_codon:yes gene_type:complete
MNHWTAQYLIDEKMFYLVEHGIDGVEGEHFFEHYDDYKEGVIAMALLSKEKKLPFDISFRDTFCLVSDININAL